MPVRFAPKMLASCPKMLLLIAGIIGSTSSATFAGGNVSVVTRSDGRIQASVTIPANEAAVRKILKDPARISKMSPDVVSVRAVEDKSCHQVTTETRGLISTMTYQSRRCSTATGWKETLVRSESFEKYEAEWQVRSTGNSTTVTFVVDVELNVPAPDFLVKRETAKSLKVQLEALYDAAVANQ